MSQSMKTQLSSDSLRIEFYRASGKGGQRRNKVATAVRITHIPTGICVTCCDERYQHKNKEIALKRLEEKLAKRQADLIAEKRQGIYDAKPNAAFGTEVIRTYRMCGNVQNVIDHRSGIQHSNPQSVLDGDIDRFLQPNVFWDDGKR